MNQNYGSFSCYNASIINSIGPYVSCHGLFSCANINSQQLLLLSGDLYVYGELALYKTNATIVQGYVQCFGYESCHESIITLGPGGDTSSKYISMESYLAGSNSTLISIANGTRFIFKATASGHGTTVFCASDQTCNIECYGNGCDNITLRCLDGLNNTNNSCLFNVVLTLIVFAATGFDVFVLFRLNNAKMFDLNVEGGGEGEDVEEVPACLT